jgi:hypothetical protein
MNFTTKRAPRFVKKGYMNKSISSHKNNLNKHNAIIIKNPASGVSPKKRERKYGPRF